MRYIACFETDAPMTEEALYDCLAVACGDECEIKFITEASDEVEPELDAMAISALMEAAQEIGLEEGIINGTFSLHEKVSNR